MPTIPIDTAVKVVDATLFRLHRFAYRASNGRIGQYIPGLRIHCLMLATVGAKTGKRRETTLLYGRDGNRLIVIASKGGSPRHPAWFINLRARPDTEVRVGPQRLAVRATVAEGAERTRLWKLMLKEYPTYNSYQARTRRKIPVVILTPRPGASTSS